jgi:hypothetical protein
MTSGQLNHVRAQPVASDLSRPVGAQALIIFAKDVCATRRGEFDQRAWQRISSCRLRPKPLDSGSRSRIVAVGVHHRPREREVDPRDSAPCVVLQSRIDGGIHHAWVGSELVGEAPTDGRRIGTQKHELIHGSTRSHKWNDHAAQRVPHDDHILNAVPERGADHIGVIVEGHRVIVDGQIHRNDLMTGLLQQGCDAVPAPGVVPRAVDQGESRHGIKLIRRSRTNRRNGTPSDRGVEQTMQQLRALSRREITAADAGIFDAPTGGVLRICDQNP